MLPNRYDAIPDSLILNNTLSLQYDASLPKPSPIYFLEPPTTYSTYPIFDDTVYTPLLVNASAPPDINITLTALFDVS